MARLERLEVGGGADLEVGLRSLLVSSVFYEIKVRFGLPSRFTRMQEQAPEVLLLEQTQVQSTQALQLLNSRVQQLFFPLQHALCQVPALVHVPQHT